MRARSLLTLALCGVAACAAPGDADPEGGTDSGAMEPAPMVVGADVPAADRDAIVGTVQALFDALETGDVDLLNSVLDADVVMQFWEERADGTTNEGRSTVEGLGTRIATAEEPLIERMWDPEVRLSGALASVWTPYGFYIGETFSHCGVDQVTLMRDGDGWRVVALNWTRQQPPACALHPDGPPAS